MERKEMPARFLAVMPPIKELWWEGNRGLLADTNKYLAIVGSRRMTDYGRRVLEMIMPDLVRAGLIIVSGMMYGVDQEAHKLCLKYGGKTIAVLGWGIEWPGLTREDRELQEKIAKEGLVISEWEKKKPELWTFPARNRIVAGLADSVLVTEAALKSGSMVTVTWAQKFGKSVLAIPGPITSKVSAGTNQLIAAGRAKMVLSAEDILCSYGLQRTPTQLVMFTGAERTNNFPHRILELLENEPLTTDEMVRILCDKVEKINVVLTEMNLSELIEERNGKWELGVKMRQDACPS
ncbi:hypothetical protein A3A84_03385 [Candidatus Collierbacteria bacterium RIFCSPLOWO2_01_FULL_50_23]|nr:MAG: hypothetical protein A3A84_03385 [Candidatus Collierbacteria bacterium RIFCSPLOWO2_01_FULL_50_23]